ncbi:MULTISPECIES: hypothetical protein [Microbacterium]|uniref:hypothetical protein n=1 Tax=Microbacterium TaxID=33882 RepID=UPI0025CFFC4E|nr:MULTISPECIES: hypothetical protein [Microbacterium]
MSTQQMTARTMSMTMGAARPRPASDVIQDVARWQAALLVGRDPGATPVGESGWPLSRQAARSYFGTDVLSGSTCAFG